MAARGTGGGGGPSKRTPHQQQRNCWLPAKARQELERKNAPISDPDDADDDPDQDNDDDDDSSDQETATVAQKRPTNKFANDGSFLEMFQKMQQQKQEQQSKKNEPEGQDATASATSTTGKPEPVNILEKTKRKPKVLKVGIIEKKPRIEPGADRSGGTGNESSSSAWNEYMREVRAYKEKFGDDDSDKNRPLVK